jgi:sigma-B regulation protein RsbU (phosphoserine phosphatase)
MSTLGSLKRAPVSTFLIQQHADEKRSPAKLETSQVERLLGPAISNKSHSGGKTAADELALAALIHSKLMSINLPSASYARLKGKTVPCSAIGGDFFDAIALGDSICAVVADVSGKGVPAAIVAAMLQGIIHAQMLANQPLQAIADMVNQFLCSRATGKYATMVLLKIWANGVAEYLNCGHVLPVLINGVRTRRLDRSNVVVGLIPTAEYYTDACELLPGDRILIFTDGITETENARGEQFGDLALGSFAHLGDLDRIFEYVATFKGGAERLDDWTLLELLYQGRESLTANSSRSKVDQFTARSK